MNDTRMGSFVLAPTDKSNVFYNYYIHEDVREHNIFEITFFFFFFETGFIFFNTMGNNEKSSNVR